jgi:hypothetical protein
VTQEADVVHADHVGRGALLGLAQPAQLVAIHVIGWTSLARRDEAVADLAHRG